MYKIIPLSNWRDIINIYLKINQYKLLHQWHITIPIFSEICLTTSGKISARSIRHNKFRII